MPIKIDNNLPAAATLAAENIFVIPENRAIHQDIRPLKIAILNLMPTKIVTETQLLRLLGNTPLQVDITLLHPATHTSKNTSADHLLRFYKTFDEVKHEKFDGMIITGAPVEEMPFEEVTYWEELCRIMEWTKTHVYSTYHICWGAQAGLYYHYGVPKHQLPQKAFGIFPHTLKGKYVPLFRGFDDTFYVPHSRHTGVHRSDVAAANPDLIIMADSPEAGLYIAMTRDGRQIFATGHAEYDPNTLQLEYERDKAKGLDIQIPAHYFPDDDPTREPLVRWRGHANLLFSNWLNYYVYQSTPYDVDAIN